MEIAWWLAYQYCAEHHPCITTQGVTLCGCYNLLYPAMSRDIKQSEEQNKTIGVRDAFN